ncbi:antitoxin VapB [Oceanospirillum multiglobuliferum]|uniref:Antitoxin n=1 Tax=Oceanospirillum multiglobuliferum TaxID=64969 RepID=A0A1T4RA33_9GAMM|nr:type II toxin-antitoxin system VapB family antitoxin [Oceanospirillum multiglobuliferum]OPX55142.1 antitoxin [Oceanospirillum multiglobuliferum]SKA12795.1 antitoxin VapB [Oceanospirillum multiglobuliferum]
MITGTVFENNKTQAVRLPMAVRFTPSVKKVMIRVVGSDRIISPVENSWDSFFMNPEATVSEDFMAQRADQIETPREAFDD